MKFKNKKTVKMKKLKYYIPFIIISLLIILNPSGCSEEPPVVPPPPPDYRKIKLSFEGISSTEIWVKITADSVELPADIKLEMNSNIELIRLTGKRDTIVYFDSLQANQTYSYKALLAEDTTVTSEQITMKTLAPTSHNFNYQTWEFGDHSSSVFYDAAIINNDDIWVVGEVFTEDSSGNTIKYNAVHWDGSDWNIKRIPFTGECSAVIYPPIRSIFSFSENDIWFARGGSLVHFDGINYFNDCGMNSFLTGSINKIWGDSSEDIYIVGNNGNIAWYNGSVWAKIESGTELALTDIYSNGNGDIYVAGVNSQDVKGIVLKGNENGEFNVMVEGEIIDESELFNPKLYGRFGTVWVDENNTLYTAGDFLYEYKNEKWGFVTSLPENYLGGDQNAIGYITSIRGNLSNDIVLAGTRNTLRHFNGIDWQQLGLPYDPSSNIGLRGVEIKGNTAVAVGRMGSKAFIILLNR